MSDVADILNKLKQCNQSDKESSCESDYCKWDTENNLCLKKCDKLTGNIDIKIKDIDTGNGEFLTSLTGLVDNMKDISGCLKDAGIYKYLKQAVVAASDTSTGGVCIDSDDFDRSFKDINIPDSTVSTGLGSISLEPGQIFSGDNFVKNFEAPFCLVESPGTLDHIYSECINDHAVKNTDCCDLLFSGRQDEQSTEDTGSGEDISEGMFSVNLNPPGEPLVGPEILKINESNIDEIANCYLDNIAAVQKNKIITEYTSDITYNIYENIPWYVTGLIIIICIYLCIIIGSAFGAIWYYVKYYTNTSEVGQPLKL